jgi:hypothetical protein
MFMSVVGYLLVSSEASCVNSCDELPLSACVGKHEDLPA